MANCFGDPRQTCKLFLVNADIFVALCLPGFLHWNEHFEAPDFQSLVAVSTRANIVIRVQKFAWVVVVCNILVDGPERIICCNFFHNLLPNRLLIFFFSALILLGGVLCRRFLCGERLPPINVLIVFQQFDVLLVQLAA